MTSPEAAPRTAAGRALLAESRKPIRVIHWDAAILAIEAEAAAGTALDPLREELAELLRAALLNIEEPSTRWRSKDWAKRVREKLREHVDARLAGVES